jgi:hypothetical protein
MYYPILALIGLQRGIVLTPFISSEINDKKNVYERRSFPKLLNLEAILYVS